MSEALSFVGNPVEKRQYLQHYLSDKGTLHGGNYANSPKHILRSTAPHFFKIDFFFLVCKYSFFQNKHLGLDLMKSKAYVEPRTGSSIITSYQLKLMHKRSS